METQGDTGSGKDLCLGRPPGELQQRSCVQLYIAGGVGFGSPPPFDGPGSDPATATRAAQYIRMSTDDQECSPHFQRETIAKYAGEHGLRVVRTYADEGRSGLTVAGRDGLSELLRDVVSGWSDFGVVLVYDVSRWGRFQDTDESAYYEFLCRRAGIRVVYVAEPFGPDGSPMSAIMKGLKRVMAAEYSRELSVKVSAAKERLARLGFRVGGTAGFGLRRQVIDCNGRVRGLLEHGQSKFVRTDRVVLVPGPAKERRVVRWVFRQVAVHARGPRYIARLLNERGVPRADGRQWSDPMVLDMITNEKYAGNFVANRTVGKLRAPRVLRPKDSWIRIDGAFPAVVEPALFSRANAVINGWCSRISDDEALRRLREVFERHGRLTSTLIDEAKDMPGHLFYKARFGSLMRAYALVGYRPGRRYGWIEGHRWRWHLVEKFRSDIPQQLAARGASVRREGRAVVVVNDYWRAAIVLARFDLYSGLPRWRAQIHWKPLPHWALIVRLAESNMSVKDYWLVACGSHFIQLGGKVMSRRARYSSTTIEPLLDIIAHRGRARVAE